MDAKLNKHPAPQLFSSQVSLYPFVSHHRDAIESKYVIDADYVHDELKNLTREKKIVFVCFSNRSGSNLLLDALNRVGFGCSPGDEFFNAESIVDHAREYMFVKFEDYLAFVIKKQGIRKCAFLKIGPHQLFWLANSGLLAKYFQHARYLLVERLDKIAQAVSLYIADETQSYLVAAESKSVSPAIVEYSANAILSKLKHIADVSSLFEYFFMLHALPYHRVRYEDLDSAPIDTLQVLSQALLIREDLPLRWEVSLKAQTPAIERQSSAMNREFISRFRREFAIGGDAYARDVESSTND